MAMSDCAVSESRYRRNDSRSCSTRMGAVVLPSSNSSTKTEYRLWASQPRIGFMKVTVSQRRVSRPFHTITPHQSPSCARLPAYQSRGHLQATDADGSEDDQECAVIICLVIDNRPIAFFGNLHPQGSATSWTLT